MRGTFVVFEGGDGVGKSTQTALLADHLIAQGREVVRTFEPGDTALGATIRRLLLDPDTGEVSARAEALLYAADKAQHVHEVVNPALERGAVVICDRYVESMLAYQGAGRVLDADEVARIAWWAVGGLRPDLTVVLDLDPDEGVGRKADHDKLEAAGAEFHARARQGFLDLAASDPERHLVLHARDPIETIAAAVLAALEPKLSEASGRVGP